MALQTTQSPKSERYTFEYEIFPENDCTQRVNFVNWVLNSFEKHAGLVNRIILTDEAMFLVPGHLNRQTNRMRAQKNISWMAETNVQDDPKIMVFGGIWGDLVIGPYFFESTVTGVSFREMIEKEVSFV